MHIKNLFHLFTLGQALESRSDVQYDEETLVPAFVSVVTGIDCLAMNQRVKTLDEHFKGMIRNLVYDATKKIKRRESSNVLFRLNCMLM